MYTRFSSQFLLLFKFHFTITISNLSQFLSLFPIFFKGLNIPEIEEKFYIFRYDSLPASAYSLKSNIQVISAGAEVIQNPPHLPPTICVKFLLLEFIIFLMGICETKIPDNCTEVGYTNFGYFNLYEIGAVLL